jgi:DNA repair protein RadC
MQTETMKLRELTVRYAVKKTDAGQHVIVGRKINSPKDCATALTAVLQHEANEVFAILCLTTKHHVIAYHEVSRGTLDSTLVHPREVFKAAILANAAAIVVAHNHPSGDPSPTLDDRDVTRRLAATGELLGIPVLDHIVVGDERYFSFKRAAGCRSFAHTTLRRRSHRLAATVTSDSP